ncbi:YeiH family protein [Actinoalloteichus hymeniacidonis]|uniref:Membrane protein n=1 Tax=Actinoalloteichus hymeniacidonis TaxID=340345 RepID=A0AAC9MZU9_9PSEU|nr:putative sulfate exporter family transporter [Actinoalloteichus hymeniacidonis]AOS64427.1 putative membrane protein [Actinoalloteichus hymeniacidonis]MBB5907505.1 putative membrane protein YadS [Actinoalloteichus hymeniacidonis]
MSDPGIERPPHHSPSASTPTEPKPETTESDSAVPIETTTDPAERTDESTPDPTPTIAWTAAGLIVVVLLAILVRILEQQVPAAVEGTAAEEFLGAVEYPVYAILLGLLANLVLSRAGIRDRLSGAFRTEFFIKTGLVLLGASINLAVVVSAAGPAIAQAVLLITVVFGFTWWLGGRLRLDDRLRALLASAVSICGVSAAIAAAGAVQAKREQLAYTASLVIFFALPSIFLLPILAEAFGLSPAVAGAWIGGNIDTTAAVTAAGTLTGEEALQIASIVKVTQNALMGVVAVALTAYFTLKVERNPDAPRPGLSALWERFPKFVLGFILASVIATWYQSVADPATSGDVIGVVNDLRAWFLILAFISIGLEFRGSALREAGWRPIGVFAAATGVNLLAGLGLATLLFSSLTV